MMFLCIFSPKQMTKLKKGTFALEQVLLQKVCHIFGISCLYMKYHSAKLKNSSCLRILHENVIFYFLLYYCYINTTTSLITEYRVAYVCKRRSYYLMFANCALFTQLQATHTNKAAPNFRLVFIIFVVASFCFFSSFLCFVFY